MSLSKKKKFYLFLFCYIMYLHCAVYGKLFDFWLKCDLIYKDFEN